MQDAGVAVDLLDLRSLSPWDSDAVLESAQRTGRVIVVHEDNQTGGFGAEILATLSERSCRPLTLRRVARPDTFLPCHFGNQIELLPSAPGVLTVAADLLDLEVSWSNAVADQGGSITLTARGASPADRHVTVVAWLVNPGETVVAGQLLAELESDKALTSLASPGTGIIDALLVTEGNSVAVGAPLVTLLAETSDSRATPAPTTDTLIPRISRRRGRRVAQSSGAGRHQREDSQTVQLSWPCAIAGSATVSNSMLADRFPGRTPESIFQLTGIENRCRMASGETLLGLALTAARRALEASDLALSDLAAIFCHTTTPSGTTPSLACQVLAGLTQATKEHPLVACDLQAACSGYLYALQVAHDFVNARPNARVLVITAEEMSKIVDPRDFDTAILFGDAASATILSGSALPDQGGLRLFRPVLYAAPDPTHALTVPNPGSGFVRMRGKEVFSKAVRCMLHALQEACEAAGTRMNDLDFLLPHQANGRIMDAIRTRLGTEGPRLIQAISQCGNTASSSIPLCLSQFSEPLRIDQRIGLCTFGGGFTWGGAVLQITQALATRQTANQESLEP